VSAQDDNQFDLTYEVNVEYPALSVTLDQVTSANNLEDLNRYYKADWVSMHLGLEIHTYHEGVIRIARSSTDELTTAQKNNILSSDAGSKVSVIMNYIPDNTLSHNDPKEFAFDFQVNPKENATFQGGLDQLKNYLETSVIDQMDQDIFKQYQLAAFKFSVDQKGKVLNAKIFESTKNETLDNLLISAIQKMPDWSPAVYQDGSMAEQAMVLTVGDMQSCVINTLNIRREN